MTAADHIRRQLVEQFLIASALWNERLKNYLDHSRFESQKDGGMGSFSIISNETRIGTRDFAESEYIDSDGKLVVIALIGDDEGYPTDMDFWKVDSSPLIEFPDPSQLVILPKRDASPDCGDTA